MMYQEASFILFFILLCNQL